MTHTEYLFAQAMLAETEQTFYLHTAEEHQQLASRMVSQATRSVKILTLDLDPSVYDKPPFIAALKQFALRNQMTKVQVLLQDNNLVCNQGHRLTDLAQRLPSIVEIRKPGKDSPQHPETFLLADSYGYLLRRLSGRYDATACFYDRLKTTRLEEIFDEIWETGEPDMELRQLYL